jgi:hypothetical protein
MSSGRLRVVEDYGLESDGSDHQRLPFLNPERAPLGEESTDTGHRTKGYTGTMIPANRFHHAR